MKSQHCHCGSDRIRVSLAPFNIDERTKRVHAILESLHESRFGPYRYQRNFEERDYLWPDCLVHDATYDLMPSGPMHIPGEELRRGLVPNCIALGSVVLANVDPSTWAADFSVAQDASPLRSPPTLARGSPPDGTPAPRNAGILPAMMSSPSGKNPKTRRRMPTADR